MRGRRDGYERQDPETEIADSTFLYLERESSRLEVDTGIGENETPISSRTFSTDRATPTLSPEQLSLALNLTRHAPEDSSLHTSALGLVWTICMGGYKDLDDRSRIPEEAQSSLSHGPVEVSGENIIGNTQRPELPPGVRSTPSLLRHASSVLHMTVEPESSENAGGDSDQSYVDPSDESQRGSPMLLSSATVDQVATPAQCILTTSVTVFNFFCAGDVSY